MNQLHHSAINFLETCDKVNYCVRDVYDGTSIEFKKVYMCTCRKWCVDVSDCVVGG